MHIGLRLRCQSRLEYRNECHLMIDGITPQQKNDQESFERSSTITGSTCCRRGTSGGRSTCGSCCHNGRDKSPKSLLKMLLKALQRTFEKLSQNFQTTFKELPKKFQMNFQRRFENVFKELSKSFQRTFKTFLKTNGLSKNV